jgi:hypothetical protein
VPAVALFVVLPVGFAVWSAVGGSGGPERPKLSRAGSVLVSSVGERDPLGIEDAPQSVRITYSLELYQEEAVRKTVDVLELRRPFDSHLVSSAAGKQLTVRVSRLGTLAFGSGGGPIAIAAAPTIGSADLRFDPVLGEAVAQDLVEVREQRRVAGRRCQVFRFGSTVSSGELRPVGSRDGEEHADVCVDADGLLLEEVWIKDGVPLQRRVATEVLVGVTLGDDRFRIANERELTTDEGNGFFREVEPTTRLQGVTYELPEAPAGFTFLGRYAVQTPRLSLEGANPLEPVKPREDVSQIDVWTNGPDLLVLSTSLGADLAALPEDAETARPVDLGGDLSDAVAVLDLRSNEVRAELEGGRFVRLAGTVPRDALVALASTLRPVEGTGVQPVPSGGS